MIGGVIDFKNLFYTKGSKLIQYDSQQKPTGLVRDLNKGDYLEFAYPRGWIKPSGDYLFVCNSKYAFFLDPSTLEICGKKMIVPYECPLAFRHMNRVGFPSIYNDQVIFKSPYNDTVFSIVGNQINPLLRVDIPEKFTVPSVVYSKKGELMNDWSRRGDKLDKLLMQKIKIGKASQTNRFHILEGYQYGSSLKELDFFYLFLDKNTNEFQYVRKEDLVDDLLDNLLNLPSREVYFFNNKMISTIWPYELLEADFDDLSIQEPLKTKLKRLQSEVQEEDNPILFVYDFK